jgi:type II secretory ATPase GspE/PulE/Tfp pilus assembly ATPase PilB-like protein
MIQKNPVQQTSTDQKQPEEQSVASRFLKDAFSHGTTDPVSFTTTLIREAVNLKASDVLLEPQKESARVRARIDGVLYKLGFIPHESYDAIAQRIKVLAQLDPTEKRRVQEGQFSTQHEKRNINIRVEAAMTIQGELIILRIHEVETIIMQLSQLGFNEDSFSRYLDILKLRSGLIVVSGPTGCGKTTTLYSTIHHINKDKNLNVMTIEDPVEYQMEGANQMQTQNEIGFTFAEGLKTILRLSPDVILVGEIRDRETAEIAVESGLTGQLVLTSLHADDAAGALFRILDLGIESYLLNSSLTGIVAQRLVRKICPDCKTEYQPSPAEVELFQKQIGKKPEKLFKGKGCFSCQNLSYQGRTGIFEVLVMNASIRDLLRRKTNEDQLRQNLNENGFITFLKDGLQKVELGFTTFEEVIKNSRRY